MPTESPSSERTKICGRCRKFFNCRAGGCWCTSMWVPAAVLEAIRQDYTDCLCSQCLQEIVENYRRDNPQTPRPANLNPLEKI